LLAGLSLAETRTLHHLLERVMAQVVQHKQGGAWICRMCHLQACGRAAGNCPAATPPPSSTPRSRQASIATVIPDPAMRSGVSE